MSEILSVIMPFHNEEATLGDIIPKVLSVKLPIPMELILVDDGSTDSSAEKAKAFLTDDRVRFVGSVRQSGKGAAVSRGIAASAGTILLIQDADLEYRPHEYMAPLSLILDGRCDFALGSRVLGSGHWARVHKIRGKPLYCLALNTGSWVLGFIFRMLFKNKITDPTTMLKVFRRECLNGVDFESRGFDWDWEILCKLLHNGRIPLEAPISYEARTPEEGKKLRMWRDGWGALHAILRYRFALRLRFMPQAKRQGRPQ